MNMIHLTEATPADIPLIRNIAMAAWPVAYSPILSAGQIEYMLGSLYKAEELQRQMEKDHQQFLLAYCSHQPVAFAGFGSHEDGIFKLYKLYVRPDVQKTGTGKTLLREVENRSRAAGAKKLILNVNRSNPALHFYEKHGFRIYQTIDIPFGPHFMLNDYLMEKQL